MQVQGKAQGGSNKGGSLNMWEGGKETWQGPRVQVAKRVLANKNKAR